MSEAVRGRGVVGLVRARSMSMASECARCGPPRCTDTSTSYITRLIGVPPHQSRERKREIERAYVCVCVRERESVCVCERERVCVHLYYTIYA